MTEPIYHFVKGKGWVPGGDVFVRTFKRGGIEYLVEHRRPVLGEFFEWVRLEPYSIEGGWCTETGEPNLDKFIELFCRFYYGTGGTRYGGLEFKPTDITVVFTPL